MTVRDGSAQTMKASIRLLLEDICSDIVRHLHAGTHPDALGRVRIDREWNLGVPGMFADIRATPVDEDPYFVEIKTGYSDAEVVQHLRRKYGSETPRISRANKVVVVLDTKSLSNGSRTVAAIREAILPSLALEIWDEERLDGHVRALFGTAFEGLSDEESLVRLRADISHAKTVLAFGAEAGNARDLLLRNALLWHFGTWRLRELREAAPVTDDRLVRPGHYKDVIVLMADLSAFTSYVRDTPDEEVVRSSLTAFYTKARYQVVNAGGMFYQFVGDEVSAFFGIPDRRPDYVEAAVNTARALIEIAASVSYDWQRRIDRVQRSAGAHVGMAMGDIGLVAQRPFDDGHLGAFGDVLNLTKRLNSAAVNGEIVISNVLRKELPDSYECEERPPTEIKNMGAVTSWTLIVPSPGADDPRLAAKASVD